MSIVQIGTRAADYRSNNKLGRFTVKSTTLKQQ